MNRIYDFGGNPATRRVTVGELRRNRREAHAYTMTTATTAAEAEDAGLAGIDALSVWDSDTTTIRAAAPDTFVIACQSFTAYATQDEILRGAMDALDAGADAIYTARGPDVVELLASQGIPVHGHLGLVPRKSTWLGGLRSVGKTAEEAVNLLLEARRFENAGGFMMEAELVAVEALDAIMERTDLVFSSLGSGTNCPLVFQFMEDICGETDPPFGHVQAFGDIRPAKAAVRRDRRAALEGFKDTVNRGGYPDSRHSISMAPEEAARLAELLDEKSP